MAKTMRAVPAWPSGPGAILSLRAAGDQFGAKCSAAFSATEPVPTDACAIDTVLVRPDGARVVYIRRLDGSQFALELNAADAQMIGDSLFDDLL
ncbi:hypothetical protein AB4Y36_19420 [Paraburkholderia sp. BR10936]|uniref:hypothetical protein n=1 Tax=Paraburkholderia sp. BR10936 TaxID=3236993 RepID=UPI0034D227EE